MVGGTCSGSSAASGTGSISGDLELCPVAEIGSRIGVSGSITAVVVSTCPRTMVLISAKDRELCGSPIVTRRTLEGCRSTRRCCDEVDPSKELDFDSGGTE